MELITAIDVSNHQGLDLAPYIERHRPEHVVVQAYLADTGVSQNVSRAQWESARQLGCTLGAYVWCYRSLDPGSTIAGAVELAQSAGVVLPILWLDCETYREPGHRDYDPGPDGAWLAAAFAAAASIGTPVGVYSAPWWIDGVFPGARAEFERVLGERPLWLADWGGAANLSKPGWPPLAGKQYSVSSPPAVDLDVFHPRYTTDTCEPRVYLSRATYEAARAHLSSALGLLDG